MMLYYLFRFSFITMVLPSLFTSSFKFWALVLTTPFTEELVLLLTFLPLDVARLFPPEPVANVLPEDLPSNLGEAGSDADANKYMDIDGWFNQASSGDPT